MKKERYLGDGVYAEFDGNSIILRANSHINPTDTITLEEEVYIELKNFVESLKK